METLFGNNGMLLLLGAFFRLAAALQEPAAGEEEPRNGLFSTDVRKKIRDELATQAAF